MILDLSGFDWCEPGSGVIKALSFIISVLNVIRWVVPVGLVAYTSYEMIKKVLNPDDKDFMKHIVNRIIAAIVIFFVPLIINVILKVVDMAKGTPDGTKGSLNTCWKQAGGGSF